MRRLPALLAVLAAIGATAPSASAQTVERDQPVSTIRVEGDTLQVQYATLLPDGSVLASGRLDRPNRNDDQTTAYVGFARVGSGGIVRYADELSGSTGDAPMQRPFALGAGRMAVPIVQRSAGRPALSVGVIDASTGRQYGGGTLTLPDGLELGAIAPADSGAWVAGGIATQPDGTKEARLMRFDAAGAVVESTPIPFPPSVAPFRPQALVVGDTSFVVFSAGVTGFSTSPPPGPLPIVAWEGVDAADTGEAVRFGQAVKALFAITGTSRAQAAHDARGGLWLGGGRTSGLARTAAAVAYRGPDGATWTRPLGDVALEALAPVPGGMAVIGRDQGGFLSLLTGSGPFVVRAMSPAGSLLWEVEHEPEGRTDILPPRVLDARVVGRTLRIAYLRNPGLRTSALHLLDIALP